MEFNQQLIEMVPAGAGSARCDDLVSAWANAEYEHDKVFNETGLFIAGGAETTRTAIAHGLRAFADHPDQWDRLAAEPDARAHRGGRGHPLGHAAQQLLPHRRRGLDDRRRRPWPTATG